MNYTWSKVKLKKSKDFQNVIKKGRKIANESFSVFFLKKSKKDINLKLNFIHCNIGVSVPQRIMRKSHQRNKCKRQMRSIISDLIKDNKTVERLKNWDLVVVLKKRYLELEFGTKKAKLLNLIFFLLKTNKKVINNE